MADIQIVLPNGMLGASVDDDVLDAMLRRIAVAASPDPEQEWAEKYGTDYDGSVFMMHQYCWCERPDCPWCAVCECPESAHHYFVDGKEVSFDESVAFFERTAGEAPIMVKLKGAALRKYEREWEKRAEEANRRRSYRHDKACRYCRGEFGNAPNFHYKPTNFHVRWYKYIGRSVEVEGRLPPGGLAEIEAACMAEVKRG